MWEISLSERCEGGSVEEWKRVLDNGVGFKIIAERKVKGKVKETGR